MRKKGATISYNITASEGSQINIANDNGNVIASQKSIQSSNTEIKNGERKANKNSLKNTKKYYIPEFNIRGLLDEGIYSCNSKMFYNRFCKGDEREKYTKVLEQLFAFAISRGVKSVIIGGSFVSDIEYPNDLDCIIVFPTEKSGNIQINEMLEFEECELDIISVVETNKDFVYSMINMLALDRYDIPVGLVEIVLDEKYDKSTWKDYLEYSSLEKLYEAREAYINRHIIRGKIKEKKVFVTLGSANKYMLWNYNIAPFVSSAGWIFAPYVFDDSKIQEYIDHFKLWICTISSMFEADISIFADEFGTIILGEFLYNAEFSDRVQIDKIIIGNNMLEETFDWESRFNTKKVNSVINLIRSEMNNHNSDERIERRFTKKYDKLLEYVYVGSFSEHDFCNNILPMYHISSLMRENHEQDLRNNFSEICGK